MENKSNENIKNQCLKCNVMQGKSKILEMIYFKKIKRLHESRLIWYNDYIIGYYYCCRKCRNEIANEIFGKQITEHCNNFQKNGMDGTPLTHNNGNR